MLAANDSIAVFLATIGLIVLVGWVIEQILKDVQKDRRARRKRSRSN